MAKELAEDQSRRRNPRSDGLCNKTGRCDISALALAPSVSHKMVKVVLNGNVLAESDSTVVVEGNHYFPPGSVNKDLLSNSKTRYAKCLKS